MAIDRGKVRNDPISHCPKGQGGRGFAESKGNVKTPPKSCEASNRKLRAKVQPRPMGRDRWKYGFKYLPAHVEIDKDGKPIDWKNFKK